MVAFQDQLTPPSPTPGNGFDVAGALLAYQAAAGGQSSQSKDDIPIVPLWRVRPAPQPQKRSSGAGSAALADRYASDVPPKPSIFQVGTPAGTGTVRTGGSAAPDYKSVNMAEAYWLDMSDEDRKAFMESAKKEGFWNPNQGADGLVSAWGKAVALAAQYNQAHSDDKSKWISPFEAIQKMAIADMAGQNLAHDGFSTETSYRKFSQNELMSNAKSVLQQELGRNPTSSEMKAFTAAVNAASLLHPQTVTRQQVDDGQGGTSAVSTVTGGNFDPNAVIDAQVHGTQEYNDFQAASVYFPALMQAVGATV